MFLVNSRLSQFLAACSPLAHYMRETTQAPLFPKVRGQFAEFLNRGSLVHLGGVPPAYQCRFAVRAHSTLASGFSGRPGRQSTSAHLRPLGPAVMLRRPGFASVTHFQQDAWPVQLPGSLSLPRPRFTRHEYVWCRTLYLLSIAYDYDVLGLGPD